MPSSWKDESGSLVCRWSKVGERMPPVWMHDISEMPGAYLAPVPDFASHSPFGGVAWFQPDPNQPA